MSIRICNALTDTNVRRATVAACRCPAQCGSCARTVCAMLGLVSQLAVSEPA